MKDELHTEGSRIEDIMLEERAQDIALEELTGCPHPSARQQQSRSKSA